MNILIAEDDTMSRLILEKTLIKDSTTQLFVAENGTKALDLVKNIHVQLAILDNQMPGYSGKDIAYRIRELDKIREAYTHIILLTADEGFSSLDQLVFDCYIQKPLCSEKLNKLNHHYKIVKAYYSSQT